MQSDKIQDWHKAMTQHHHDLEKSHLVARKGILDCENGAAAAAGVASFASIADGAMQVAAVAAELGWEEEQTARNSRDCRAQAEPV